MTLGSLFSGIGGIDLAFERAGFAVAWQVEIDRQARSVLARHWPDVPKFDDVREVGKKQLSKVDVIAGGFPCQDLSVAGKRGGIVGERSGLYFEMVRIVHELRPSFFVWENVPGLLSSYTALNPPPDNPIDGSKWDLAERSCFEAVLAALHRIGFSGCWRSLDAQFFGVPQRRERVFGVFARGRSGAERCAEILSLSNGVSRHSQASREAGQSVAATIRGRSSSRGVSAPGRGGEGDVNIFPCLRTNQWNNSDPGMEASMMVLAPALRASGVGTERAGDTRGQDCVPAFIPELSPALKARDGKGPSSDGDGDGAPLVACTLPASEGGVSSGMHPVIAFAQNERDEVRDLNGIAGALAGQPGMKQQTFIAHTLSSEGADASEDGTGRGTPLAKESQSGTRTGDVHATLDSNKGSRRQEGVMLSQGVRRLTPRECERLQGLPDDWTRWDADGKEIKDGPRYRMIGNGVAVPCVEWIARRIMAAMGKS